MLVFDRKNMSDLWLLTDWVHDNLLLQKYVTLRKTIHLISITSKPGVFIIRCMIHVIHFHLSIVQIGNRANSVVQCGGLRGKQPGELCLRALSLFSRWCLGSEEWWLCFSPSKVISKRKICYKDKDKANSISPLSITEMNLIENINF